MKKIVSFLIMTALAVNITFAAEDKTNDDGVKLFAVATVPDLEADHIEGDSVLVTLTLYSSCSFNKIENLDKALPKMKDARVRAYAPERRLTQNIATYNGKRYYSVVAEQFVVAFHEVGNVVFPVRRYNVELAVGVRNRSYSPFDDFFGFDSPFMERQRIIQKKCASENLKMKVVKRPPKTMHDIERGGAVLM